MAVYTRTDGSKFVLRCYREILSYKKFSHFKKELLGLAQQYGEYICFPLLPKKTSTSQIEVIFSKTPGYLLGETVFNQLGRPTNLIFCEAIANQQFILVLVRAGKVYVDAQLDADQLLEELRLFLGSRTQFQLVTFGDIPIVSVGNPEADKFFLDRNRITNHKILKQSLLQQLKPETQLKLVAINQALKYLPKHRAGKIMMVCLAIMVGMSSLLFNQTLSIPVLSHLPFFGKSYLEKLKTPEPALQLQLLSTLAVRFFTIPGWTVTALNFDGYHLQAQAKRTDGTMTDLINWAQQQGFSVRFNDTSVNLSTTLKLAERKIPLHLASLAENRTQLITNLTTVLLAPQINFGQIVHAAGNYESHLIQINFTQLSPDMLALLGMALQNLPVAIINFNAQYDQGFVSGNLNLILLGT